MMPFVVVQTDRHESGVLMDHFVTDAEFCSILCAMDLFDELQEACVNTDLLVRSGDVELSVGNAGAGFVRTYSLIALN